MQNQQKISTQNAQYSATLLASCDSHYFEYFIFGLCLLLMDLDDGPLYGIIIYTGNSWQVDGDGRWTMTDRLSQGRIETTDHKKYKNVDGGRREDRWTKVRLSRGRASFIHFFLTDRFIHFKSLSFETCG